MKKKEHIIISILIIGILNYIGLYLFKDNNIVFVVYHVLLTCIIFIISVMNKKEIKINYILLLLINLLCSGTILVNSNTLIVYLSNFFYLYSLIYLVTILNTSDDVIDQKYKDAELYYFLVFPIIVIYDIISFFLPNEEKHTHNTYKRTKIVKPESDEKSFSDIIIKSESNEKSFSDISTKSNEKSPTDMYLEDLDNIEKKKHLYTQIIIGFAIGIPTFLVTLVFLSVIEADFTKIFNLSLFSNILWSFILALWSFILAGIVVLIITVYKSKKRRYNQFIIETISDSKKLNSYSIISNIILLSTLPLQTLFVIYQFSKLFLSDQLYGKMISDAFTLINILVIVNMVALIIFYFFYSQSNLLSKFIRIVFILVNYMLLIISASQIITYINNFSALTPKRYYGLVTILILILFNTILLIKIANKNITIKYFIYIFMILTIMITMYIDADSVIYKYNTSQTFEESEQLDTDVLNTLYPKWYKNEYNILDD